MCLCLLTRPLQYSHSRPSVGAVGACEEILRELRRHHQNSVAILARCTTRHCSPSSGAFALRRQREHGQGIHEVLLVPAGHHRGNHIRVGLLHVDGSGDLEEERGQALQPIRAHGPMGGPWWPHFQFRDGHSVERQTRHPFRRALFVSASQVPKGLATVDFSDNICLFRFREPSAYVAEKVSEKVTDECYYYCHRCYYY